jgi:hypothetical protein
MPDGWGFLRHTVGTSSERDAYVRQTQIRYYHLKPGDVIRGEVRPPNIDDGDKYYGLLKIEAINGQERVIEVTLTVHKQAPDASGPWLPEIEVAIPELESPLLLPLDEAEELGEMLLHEVDGARRQFQEPVEDQPTIGSLERLAAAVAAAAAAGDPVAREIQIGTIDALLQNLAYQFELKASTP